jgi:hypothetical protein
VAGAAADQVLMEGFLHGGAVAEQERTADPARQRQVDIGGADQHVRPHVEDVPVMHLPLHDTNQTGESAQTRSAAAANLAATPSCC